MGHVVLLCHDFNVQNLQYIQSQLLSYMCAFNYRILPIMPVLLAPLCHLAAELFKCRLVRRRRRRRRRCRRRRRRRRRQL